MAEELTTDQYEALRAQLVDLATEIRGLLSLAEEGTRVVDLDLPIGRLSRMDAIQQQQMAQAGRHDLEIRLRQVEAALAACERGTYGECQSCEEPIGHPRLAARPETPRCIECQDSLERRRGSR